MEISSHLLFSRNKWVGPIFPNNALFSLSPSLWRNVCLHIKSTSQLFKFSFLSNFIFNVNQNAHLQRSLKSTAYFFFSLIPFYINFFKKLALNFFFFSLHHIPSDLSVNESFRFLPAFRSLPFAVNPLPLIILHKPCQRRRSIYALRTFRLRENQRNFLPFPWKKPIWILWTPGVRCRLWIR